MSETFDAWFNSRFLDPDGGSRHLPDWLKEDLRSAWDAGRVSNAATLPRPEPATTDTFLHNSFAYEARGSLASAPQSFDRTAAWQPFETAPKDGTWIIARCNDGSRLYRISWGRAQNGDMCWCSSESIVSYGDGLFSPNGGWILCPATAVTRPHCNEGE